MATLPRSDHAQGFVHQHVNMRQFSRLSLSDAQLSRIMNLMTRGKHECWGATLCAIVSYPTISRIPRVNTDQPSKWVAVCNNSEIRPRAVNVSATSLARSVCG